MINGKKVKYILISLVFLGFLLLIGFMFIVNIKGENFVNKTISIDALNKEKILFSTSLDNETVVGEVLLERIDNYLSEDSVFDSPILVDNETSYTEGKQSMIKIVHFKGPEEIYWVKFNGSTTHEILYVYYLIDFEWEKKSSKELSKTERDRVKNRIKDEVMVNIDLGF